MSTLAIEIEKPLINNLNITDDDLSVELADGRTITVPIVWYPRLFYSNSTEKNNWRFIGDGEGIHWIDIDEDISAENLILGKPSQESANSLKKWLTSRS